MSLCRQVNGRIRPGVGGIVLAASEGWVVVTKDSSFVTAFLLHGTPPKLLLISTGNIPNDALPRLLAANLTTLETAFVNHIFIELNTSAITIHA